MISHLRTARQALKGRTVENNEVKKTSETAGT